MASQKIKRALIQILIICLGFGCASSSNKIAYVSENNKKKLFIHLSKRV